MVDAFSSIYKKDYRLYRLDDIPEKSGECFIVDPEENFLPEKDSKVIYNPQRDEELIQRLRKNRLQSTYRVSYRHPGNTRGVQGEFSDEFMNYFNKVFEEKTQAVLRPPATARTILGYSRFDYYYTGFSTYQDEISKAAYQVFKKKFDEGISRLFPKRDKERQRKMDDGTI